MALFLAAATLAGCSLWAPAPAPPAPDALGTDDEWKIVPALDTVNLTANGRATLPVTLVCGAPPGGAVRARVVGFEAVAVPINASCATTVFLPVHAEANTTESDAALSIEVLVGETVVRRAPGAANLSVLAPSFGWATNVTAVLVYTARYAGTDEVFFTNDGMLLGLPYVRSDDHRSSPRALEIRGPSPALPDAFFETLAGMQAGESRTVDLSPERAYGNATLLVREARDERVSRHDVLPAERLEMTRATFDEHIRETRQGDPADHQAGDAFFVEQGGNRWRYVVLEKTETIVAYRLAPLVGDRYTLYPMWPNASEVTVVTEEQVALYTTPTSAPGDVLTWRSVWPNATTFVAVDDDAFALRHAPAVGLRYADREGARLEVVELTDTHVVVARPNPHPLAGRALTFDLRVLSLAIG